MKTDLIERDGGYFAPRHLGPLSDAKFKKHEEEQDEYEQKQASVREILYRTIDHSTFNQVKNEPNTKAVWNKIISIHANKGKMYKTNLLTQLQNSHFVKGENMREHLTKLTEIREKLSEIGCPISEESYIAYIRTSLSLTPNYRALITTLAATSFESGRKLSSTNLIWHLNEEANTIKLQENINQSSEAMMAAVAKARDGKSTGGSKKGVKCSKCGKIGHTKDKCGITCGNCKKMGQNASQKEVDNHTTPLTGG